MSDLTFFANFARKRCPGEPLAHRFADVCTASRDLASAAREAEALLSAGNPSTTLSMIATTLFELAGHPVPTALPRLNLEPTPTNSENETSAAYRERRTAELAAVGKMIGRAPNPFN